MANLLRKLLKKNPDSVRLFRDEDKEIKSLKKECLKLAKEISRIKPNKEEGSKAFAIITEKKAMEIKLNEKYNGLMTKVKHDYEIETLLVMKMYMQRHLKIFNEKQIINNYVPSL